MNFFGMGGWEIGVILIVALIIFGPGKLPEVMGQVGKTVRDFRRMTGDLTGEFERSTGIKDIKKTLTDELTGIKSEVTGVGTSIQKEVNSSASTVTNAAKSATSGSTSTSTKTTNPGFKPVEATSSASTSTATSTKPAAAPVATKKDPLADLVAFDSTPANQNGTATAAQTIPASSANGNASSNGEAVTADALSRARLRRQQAGYNRPPASVG